MDDYIVIRFSTGITSAGAVTGPWRAYDIFQDFAEKNCSFYKRLDFQMGIG